MGLNSSGIGQPGGHAGFAHELERCARRVYELRADASEQQSWRLADRIFDRDRRVVIGLAGQLLVAVALAPWLGVWIVVAALVVLYVGAMASTAWTLGRLKRADARGRVESIELAVGRALATCPPLTTGTMALVIRLGNLAAIPPTARSVDLLQATLREAEAHPELQGWPFLVDAAALVNGGLGRLAAPAGQR